MQASYDPEYFQRIYDMSAVPQLVLYSEKDKSLSCRRRHDDLCDVLSPLFVIDTQNGSVRVLSTSIRIL